MIAVSVAVIILLFASFGILHTILASIGLKQRIAKNYPQFLPYYRLLYNLFALIHFYFIFELSPDIDIKLYDFPFPYDIVVYSLQIAALVFILYTLRYFDAKEFLGFKQILRARNNTYQITSLDEESVLQVSGPYRISRHPLYFGSILFLLARPYLFLDSAVQLMCIIAYFYIGAYYEEKKLLQKFGSAYEAYRNSTAMIFPLPWRNK